VLETAGLHGPCVGGELCSAAEMVAAPLYRIGTANRSTISIWITGSVYQNGAFDPREGPSSEAPRPAPERLVQRRATLETRAARTWGTAGLSGETHNLIGSGSGSAVDFAFSDIRLQRLCESGAALSARFGDEVAGAVQAHLASIRAVSCVEELRHLPGRCRERDGRLHLALPREHRLQLEPLTTSEDGATDLDWTTVRSVKILAIAA
jgi:hypothetical protein